jgi:hypothetical protein
LAVTAVISNGNLLLELDDGSIVNAGRVQGSPGPAGAEGKEGPRGADGRHGKDGKDGSKIITGIGAPDVGEGEENDLYIDVASSILAFYQKVGGNWVSLGGLRSGSSGGGVSGGDGAGGSGGNIIVHPSPGEPTTDKDGNVLNEGDLWYDPTTGWLYVYHLNEWIVVAGEPPVIISDFPPDQDYGEHPIQEGSLWFDSLQLALYVAVKDSAQNMVWITAIPADRTAVDDVVNPFAPTGYAANGDEVTNPTTGIVYKYNAVKKQWIDKAPKMGGAYYQEDAPDPTLENLRPGDLWIDSDTHNLYVWTGDTWSQVNPGCNSNPKVHFQPVAPEGTQHIRGDLWIDSDTNKLFTWNGEIWMEVGASCGGTGTEEFVKIVGDTMTGPLILHDEDGNQAEITIASQAVHKAYVDDQDAKLQQEIINLEEEINNIQASVEGGRWNFTINPSVNSGEFRMSGGSFTQQNQTITIHRQDLAAADHYWSQSEIGHYLEILDQTIGSTNNALYVITDITKDTGAGQTVFEAELVRGTGSPTNNTSCVIKTFELQGGDPTAYVRKVGDEMSGKLHLQDDQGNPQVIEDDDQAVHKQYVDTMLFGQDRECVELNGGKLCGGEPMPRFYNMPEWSYKQKTATGVAHKNSLVQWWEGKKRWVKYTRHSGTYHSIKIYISKTELLDNAWELFIEQSTNTTNSNVTMGMVAVGKELIYIKQSFSGNSANNNNLTGKLFSVSPSGNVSTLKSVTGLSGFYVNSVSIDAEGNLGCIIKNTTYYYSSGFTHDEKVTLYNAKTGNLKYTSMTNIVSGARGVGTATSQLPQRFMKGFYINFSTQSNYLWDYTHTTHVWYYDPDNNWSSTDVSSYLWPARTYFDHSSTTGGAYTRSGIRMSLGDGSGAQPYTWITYNQDLNRFFCVQQYSDNGKYTTDGSLGFRVYRSKEYKYEDIVWKTFDWRNLFLFSNGAEMVLDSPDSYCKEVVYVAGELITKTISGVSVGSGQTAGDPIKKHRYGKMWGSVDGGKTWQGRSTEVRDSNGLLVASHYPYIPNAGTDSAPIPGNGDYINVYFAKSSDTNDEFYDDQGKVANYLANDDELEWNYQRYDLPFNAYTGQQALFWNGDQINLPPEEIDIDIPATQIAYAGTDGLTDTTYHVSQTSTESNVSDGNFYSVNFNTNDASEPYVTGSTYLGLFLTSGWIKKITKNIPADATEVEAYDMTGDWRSQDNNNAHRTVTAANVSAATLNGIAGVAVRFVESNVSSGYSRWRANLPVTVRYVTTYGESGLPIIPLN